MSPADQVLFDQWITRRDASAFTRLAEKYATMVYAVGRRITGNTHDAEDVAQAAFEALASQRRAPRAHLGAWLHRVATYRALNHLKAEGRRSEREARYDRERPKHTEFGWDDIYELVDEAIAALPDKQRDVVVAHYLEGKTHDAIARELGISRPAVTQRVQAGVAGIRTALGKRGVAVPLVALGALLANGAEAAAPAALAAQLGKIALSGYVGSTGTGIGLWQGIMAGGACVALALLGVVAFWTDGGSREIARSEVSALAAPTDRPVTEAGSEMTSNPQLITNVDSAQTSVSSAPQASDVAKGFTFSTQGARISGQVVDNRGNPVAGAQVDLLTDENLRLGGTVFSDGDGLFGFGGILPAEGFTVSAFAKRDGRVVGSNEVPIGPMKRKATYEVVLTLYDGTIAGRVVDLFGSPLSGVKVVAHPQGQSRARSYLPPVVPSAMTDVSGQFRIEGLFEGEHEISLELSPARAVTINEKVWSDGIGVLADLELVYVPPLSGKLVGAVLNEDGEPVREARVEVEFPSEGPRTELKTNEEGVFRMGFEGPMGGGLISLYVFHPEYKDAEAHDLSLNHGPHEFTLTRAEEQQGEAVEQ